MIRAHVGFLPDVLVEQRTAIQLQLWQLQPNQRRHRQLRHWEERIPSHCR